MSAEDAVTDDHKSSSVFVGTSKPRFDGFEPKPTADVGFSRVIQPDEPEASEPKADPEASEPDSTEPESGEQAALVPVDPEGPRVKIVPHIEIDYSNYTKIDYPRVDPAVKLRSVQEEAIDTYFSETVKRRVIISLPTGTGKTITGLSIAGRVNGRVLWIAHRDELIEQPAQEIQENFPGLNYGIEKASQTQGAGRRVVISSIQTLSRKGRLAKLMHGAPFDLVIYDECHHVTAAQSMRVLSWLGCFREDERGPRLLGLTATIERSDKTSLGHVFEDVVYSLSIQEAIELGFLVPPKSIKVYLPFGRLKKGKDGDVSISDADREAERLGVAKANAVAIAVNCGSRKTIVFTTSVDQSKRTAEECQKLGIKAEWVSGSPYMNKTERKAALKRFANNEIQVLTCADLLCLDQETEILTRSGWVGMDEMTEDHLVANWSDGEIFFAKPKAIYRRSRAHGEAMVSLPSNRCSIRVTDRHALVWRTRGAKAWRKSEAMDLVVEKSGAVIEIPVSGVCAPEKFSSVGVRKTATELKRLVSAAAFNIRNREGYDWDSSFAEGERRVRHRYIELREKAPDELTQDECMLIGLWIADGSKSKLQSGGVEYTISQGVDWPILVEWVEDRLRAVGVDYRKRLNPAKNAWIFSLPRGTGGGSQERRGVFAFEAYLDKDGSEMLWGLNEQQFDALLFGYWVGDGLHKQGDMKPREGYRASGANVKLMEKLQAIAVCRGYRTSLRKRKNGVSKIDGRQFWIYLFQWRKASTHIVSGRINRHRPAQSKRLQVETEWKNEFVWCVKSDSGNIVTRRRGTVSIVGNCEGYDDKSISAVVIARPTMSQPRWIQMAGRGLRTHAHKIDCLLIDIGCSDHRLVTADILLKTQEGKIKRKPRRRTDVPVDSNTEWTRLQSYLRSARIDTIEHGEITFARVTDDLIVTAAMDSNLVILRRVDKGGEDLWVIEHKGLVYTMEPLTLQECMSVCDTLMPSFGGSAKPDSPEWDKATEGPTPPPGIMPGARPEATRIVDPSAQLPLAMKFVTGTDPAELVDRVNQDLMNTNAATFARGLRLAFSKKRCHLLDVSKGAPANRHKWGWAIRDAHPSSGARDAHLSPGARDACGPMVGWIYQDIVCVDPSVVELARQMLRESGEKDVDIKTSMLRTHLGVVSRTFKNMRRDWIKVKAKDVEPSDDEIEELPA